MIPIQEATFFILGLGAFCGLVLSAASRIFYGYEHPRIEEVIDCLAGANWGGCGKRVCDIGCLGHGDCVRACLFDALSLGPKGFPVVDEEKCVGCGACERTCPKHIIEVKAPSERLLHFNQYDECLAPCRQTCPAEIDIPLYIVQIRKGDYEGAVHTIRERNPFLLACGWVCPHPCKTNCRHSKEGEPVSINQLKRFVADYEMASGRRLPISMAPSIHQYIMGEDVTAEPKELNKKLIPQTIFDQVLGIEKKARPQMIELPVAERIKSFMEVDQVLTEEAALAERTVPLLWSNLL